MGLLPLWIGHKLATYSKSYQKNQKEIAKNKKIIDAMFKKDNAYLKKKYFGGK